MMKRRQSVLIGGVIVVGVVGFVAGMQTQKLVSRSSSSTTSKNAGQYGYGSGGGGSQTAGGFRRNGVFGQVASISGTTMTVTGRSGSTTTVSLANNPTVSDSSGGQDTISSIQTGDSVAVMGTKNSDGSYTATTVRILPAGGAGGGSGGAAPSSGSVNTDGATPSGT